MNVLIIGGNYDYVELFKSLGHKIIQSNEETTVDYDLIVFTGGADVSPELYGDQAHPFTGNDINRDKYETLIYNHGIANKIPMVGICRGGQFLNVMNGGRMYQHVSNHTRPHDILDMETGETIYVSSTHHQMIMPTSAAKIVATARNNGMREWYEGEVFKKDISELDIEVVYYAATNSLCFQPHPEFHAKEYIPMQDYFKRCLEKYLAVK